MRISPRFAAKAERGENLVGAGGARGLDARRIDVGHEPERRNRLQVAGPASCARWCRWDRIFRAVQIEDGQRRLERSRLLDELVRRFSGKLSSTPACLPVVRILERNRKSSTATRIMIRQDTTRPLPGWCRRGHARSSVAGRGSGGRAARVFEIAEAMNVSGERANGNHATHVEEQIAVARRGRRRSNAAAAGRQRPAGSASRSDPSSSTRCETCRRCALPARSRY